MMEIERISTLGEWQGIVPAWRDLLLRTGRATPFQTPEWLLHWWSFFGAGELCVLAFWAGSKLVGLAPFQIWSTIPGGQRRLLFIGTGLSDYLDVLCQSGCEQPVRRGLFDFFEKQQGQWDICDLQQLRSDSPLLETFVERAGWRSDVHEQEVTPILELPGSVKDLPEVIPPLQLDKWKRFQEGIRAQVEIFPVHGENFLEAFDCLIEMHTLRWHALGLPGVFADPAVQEFHRRVASAFLDRGMLRAYSLRLERTLGAVLYGFALNSRFYYYMGGINPAYRKYHLDAILEGYAIERALAEGFVEFDFSRGGSPAKYNWGARNRTNFRRVISKLPQDSQVLESLAA